MDIISAILAINPSAQVSVNAEDLDQITWHAGTEVISKSDIQAKQAELKAVYDPLAYSRSRKEEYDNYIDVLAKNKDRLSGMSVSGKVICIDSNEKKLSISW